MACLTSRPKNRCRRLDILRKRWLTISYVISLVVSLALLTAPSASFARWGSGGFGSLVNDLRTDVKNRIRELKGQNPEPNPNLKYALPVSFLHVPEEQRDGEAARAQDIEVWTMPKDKAKLALYYGVDGVEDSLPWRLYCLICQSETVRHLNRLMATRKEQINIYVMVQEHVYGKDLGILGYHQSRDAIIFPWKMPEGKTHYEDLANPERLRGLLLHEVAHSQDKTKYVEGGYGPDGSHSLNEITHNQMAYLEGWAYFNEALVSSESRQLISGTVDRGCAFQEGRGYLKKESTKADYEYVNRPVLTFDDFLSCEAYPAAVFLALLASEPLFPEEEMNRIMAVWEKTNRAARNVLTIVREYAQSYPKRAFAVATIVDVLTDFSGSSEFYSSFLQDERTYEEVRRAKIKRLWQAIGKTHTRISFAALAAGDIDGLIDIHLPEPVGEPQGEGHYIVEIVSARIKDSKESGEKWDLALPYNQDKSPCDPYVAAYVNGYQSPQPFLTTNVKKDETKPRWSSRAAIKLLPKDKVVFYLFDKDKYNDDLIGECISLTGEELGLGGTYHFRNCSRVEELTVTIKSVKPDDGDYMKLLGQGAAE